MAKRQPKPKDHPPEDKRPGFTGLDIEDEEDAGSPIPDDDGWIRLQIADGKPKGGQRAKGKGKKPRG